MCLLKLVRVQDSLCEDNRSAFVLGLAVLLTSLGASVAAPRNHQKDTEWFTNPCSRPNPLRHGRSTAENQLKYFIKRIDHFYGKLGKLYKNGTHNYQPSRNKCLKVNSFLRSMQKAPNSVEAMHVFYKKMIQIARLIDKLKDIPVRTEAKFNVAGRKKIFEETKENLRLVICEFNDTLSKSNGKSVSHATLGRKMNTNKCFPNSLDMTRAQLLDFDFYKKLKKFFKQSQLLLRQRKKKDRELRTIHKRTKQQK